MHVAATAVTRAIDVLISELSGRSNLVATMGNKFNLKDNPEALRKVLDRVMELENKGYVFEAADASFELLVRKLSIRRFS